MTDSPPRSTHAIILAAGSSSRMGTPKQLLEFRGETLLNRCILEAHKVPFAGITVTLGAFAGQILPTLPKLPGLRVFINPGFRDGLGNSIASSLRHVLKSEVPESMMLILADQPFLEERHLNALFNAHRPGTEEILVSDYGNQASGPPVLMTESCYGELCRLNGDKGAKTVIAQHPEMCRKVSLPGFDPVDIDTEEAYRSLLGQSAE